MNNRYGETKKTGRIAIIDGIKCEILKAHFPDVQKGSEPVKWRWHTAYRFTVPGWPECTITNGLTATRRVIRGRLDSAYINAEKPSVLDAIRAGRNYRETPEAKDRQKRHTSGYER